VKLSLKNFLLEKAKISSLLIFCLHSKVWQYFLAVRNLLLFNFQTTFQHLFHLKTFAIQLVIFKKFIFQKKLDNHNLNYKKAEEKWLQDNFHQLETYFRAVGQDEKSVNEFLAFGSGIPLPKGFS